MSAVKEEAIPEEVQKILQDFEELIADELPNTLPPLRDIQGLIYRISHTRMSSKKKQ